MDLLQILMIFDLLEFMLGLPEFPDVFEESLICGGADAIDKGIEYFFRYNTSSALYCFFELPHHPDVTPFAPGHEGKRPRGESTERLVNMTAAREHCAKYSATLPLVVPDTELFWILPTASKAIRGEIRVVPLGITKMVMKSNESAEITWDDGKTSMIVGKTFATNPETKQKCCRWLRGLDESKLKVPDFQVLWHILGNFWDIGPPGPIPGLLVLCQQNLTELLTFETTSTKTAVSPPVLFSQSLDRISTTSATSASFSQDASAGVTKRPEASTTSVLQTHSSRGSMREDDSVFALLLIMIIISNQITY